MDVHNSESVTTEVALPPEPTPGNVLWECCCGLEVRNKRKKDRAKCSHECGNCCFGFGQCLCGFGQFLIWSLYALAILGLVYLYLVPLSNGIALVLFADTKCRAEGVWGVCDGPPQPYALGTAARNGGVAFFINLITFGMAALGTMLLVASLRTASFRSVKDSPSYCHWQSSGKLTTFCNTPFTLFCIKFWQCFCCQCGYTSEWDRHKHLANNNYDSRHNQNCCFGCFGPCMCNTGDAVNMLGAAIVFYIISYIAFAAITSFWAGRELIFATVRGCMQYQGTKVGMDGCMLNGAYVDTLPPLDAGAETLSCSYCQNIGVPTLFLPLIALPIFILLFHYYVWRLRKLYDSVKSKMAEERQAAEKELRQYPEVQRMESGGVGDADDASAEADSVGENDWDNSSVRLETIVL